jgi:hypothetical protein
MKHLNERKIKKIIEVMEKRGIIDKQLRKTVMERYDTRNLNRKHNIALCAKLALEEAMDLPIDRPQNQ